MGRMDPTRGASRRRVTKQDCFLDPNKKPRTWGAGFSGLRAILDYLASLGGHMGEAFTTPLKPADWRPFGFFWAPFDQASLSLDPNKNPALEVRGFSGLVGNTGLEPVTSTMSR